MDVFWNFALLGLGLGAIYALAAQGIVLIARGSGVVNFAHAAVAALGTYVYVRLDEAGVPVAISVSAALCVGFATGLGLYWLVMRRLRDASPLTNLVATLGVLSVLQAGLVGWPLDLGSTSAFVDGFLPTGRVEFTDTVGVGQERLWLLAIAAALTALLWAGSRFTRFGLTTQAVAENPEAAAALGRSPDVVAGVNWGIGSALAVAAGVLVVPIIGFSVLQLLLLLVPALAAALVGSFRSFPLTLVGGLGIGVGESLLVSGADWLPGFLTEPGWSKAVPFVVIVVVLAVSGSSLPSRADVVERRPQVGSGRVRPGLVVVTALVAGVAIQGVGGNWALDANTLAAVIQSLGVATIALSLVVVSGYTGQLSLAQYALAGVGAYVAARSVSGGELIGLVSFGEVPFELAVLLAVAVAVPIGVLVGLPAVRTRGVNLAIATLGLALLIERVVLGNADYTGGVAGTQVEPQTFFGISIDSVTDQRRYGLFCLGVFTLCALVTTNLRRGRSGRRLIAVRTNERAAAALGISVAGAKLSAFAVASGMAALGGVLLAFTARSVVFTDYTTTNSIQLVVQTVLGGIGFVPGAIFAGFTSLQGLVVHLVDEWFGISDLIVILIAGLALLVALVAFPDGVVATQARVAGRMLDRAAARLLRRSPPAVELPVADVERVPPKSLAARGLTVSFGGVHALRSVDLDVGPGEVVGLIGPNGAGKTTLIDTITGFTRAAQGTVELDGRPIHRMRADRRAAKGVSRSFQSLELFEDVTVLDNLRIAADPHHRGALAADLVWPRHPSLPGALVAAIREFGLEEDLERLPSDLPYGRRRLVAIARAIASGPSVLLLDEPAAGLDERETAELGRLIRRLADEWGIAVLLVEHDVGLVFRVCDRVTALDFGAVIASGTPDEVSRDATVRDAYLGNDDEHAESLEPTPVVEGALR